MKTLKVRNWERWQSYRRDRGQPPWIKLHRQLLRDPNWVCLSDTQRGQLVVIWLLAADRDGVIPASPSLLKKLCFMDSEPDLQVFMEYGFIEHDSSVTSPRRQSDVTEKRRVEEIREEKEKLLTVAKRSVVSDRIDLVLSHTEQQSTEAERRIELARVVFTYWAARTSKDPKRTKWDEKRKARLVARLKENQDDVCELLCVVDGALKDDFHSGNNTRNRPFLQIQTIFRDREMVEKLAVLSPHFGKSPHPFMAAP